MMVLKICLYIVSLSILFFFFIILTINIDFNGFSLYKIISNNIIATASLIMLVLSGGCWIYINHHFNNIHEVAAKVVAINNGGDEYIVFLSTYVLPLVFVDTNNIRNIIVITLFLILMGYILVRYNLFYGNPVLAIAGYRVYNITIEIQKKKIMGIVISRDILDEGDFIERLEIDKGIWLARRGSNDFR